MAKPQPKPASVKRLSREGFEAHVTLMAPDNASHEFLVEAVIIDHENMQLRMDFRDGKSVSYPLMKLKTYGVALHEIGSEAHQKCQKGCISEACQASAIASE